jgi:beta-mannosidase
MREAIAGRAVCFAWICAMGSMGSLSIHAQDQAAKNAVIELNQNWQFRQTPAAGQNQAGEWMPATVPGDVHLDLLTNKKIPDPFYRDNESSLQWIEKVGWEYQVVFQATPALLARSHVDLVFNGLDAACQVTLNGVQILSANNMFRIWRVPARAHLHAGSNTLHVVFPSPIDAAAAAAASDLFRLQSKTEDKTYVRKAAYEYGWDWGPRFVTSGIWRPVKLEAWDRVRIADFALRQRDVSKEVAHLDAEVEIEAANDGPVKVNLSYDDNGRPVTIAVTMNVHAGMNVIDLPVEILQPRLWYPAGYGDQPLYEFTAEVGSGNQAADSRTLRTGLRSIELRRQLDQWGRSFEFVVNGVPVFAKGANVIPFDSFPDRVTSAEQRRILESARDANMNMIRVWGGGYYESDEFYEICDELGLMVWQDFMFGNDWQPGTYAFKQNIEAEAEDQVRRLRNHPSIALWCGNNETEMAFNWAPRPSVPDDVRLLIWQDYLTEFGGILPAVVARLDAETPYWPSSPSADYEAVSPIFHSGDEHIWDVWHGLVPFSTYETHHPRFVTEFGFQSFPEMRTIEAFTEPGDRSSIFTPVMLAHQKNADGNSIIQQYMQRDYPAPRDFASFLYVSQVLQAEGIKIGAEYFRRSRPETMGALFWQLNDCWPVASWSSIDYFGRWKALQYYARRFFAPVLVSPQLESGSVKVYIVSDKTVTFPARLRVRLMDFDGKVLLDETNPVDVAPLASKDYLDWHLKKLSDASGADTSRVVVVADLTAGGSEMSRNLLYLAPVKDIHLRQAQLRVETSGAKGSYTIRITSPVLARSVYLSFSDLDVKVSDNYFDLLPGETAEIQAQSSATLDALRKRMGVISLRDAFGDEGRRTTITAAP